MQIFVIAALIVAILAAIFALQNAASVTLTLYFWSIHSSLTLALLVALVAGVLFSLLLYLPGSIRSKMALSSQQKKLTAVENERDTYQKKSEEAEKNVAKLEEQLASFSAALDNQQTDEASAKK